MILIWGFKMTKKTDLHCSFCSKERSEVTKLIQGPDVYICDECVDLCKEMLDEDENNKDVISSLSPQELKEHLDKYVIGQEDAKKALSVAVSNHFLRINSPCVEGVCLEKSNCIMVGSSGSGKTLLVKTIAEKLNVPFYIADATALTESGYVGDDVQNIIAGLILAADGDVSKAEKGIIFIDELDKKAKKGQNISTSRDVSGEGVQQALLKIIEGSDMKVSLQGSRKHPQAETTSINTDNILFVVGGAFVGIEDIINKRLNKNKSKIGFHATNDDDVENPLKQVESSDFIEFGLIPELIGRLPQVIQLDTLTEEQLIHVLTEPKNAITKQYETIFKINGINLIFSKESLQQIAKKAIMYKTGARSLRSVMDKYLTPLQYQITQLIADKVESLTLLEGFFEGEENSILKTYTQE